MTKLPPGFTHEAKLQLSRNPPFDTKTQAPVLDLDNYCCGEWRFRLWLHSDMSTIPGLLGAHGLSILIVTLSNIVLSGQLMTVYPDN